MKILIVGNCQSRPVAELLQLASDEVEIIGQIIVHLAKDSEQDANSVLCDEADIILAQQVASTYPVQHVSTDFIRSRWASKVVTWTNVFFQGQNPDLYYVTSKKGGRINGPADVYHSKALIDLWKTGVSASEVKSSDYLSSSASADELSQRITKSLSDLAIRENGIDVSMHDYIVDNWTSIPLFHTFNHPNVNTVLELCNRICHRIGLPSLSNQDNTLTDHLSLIVPPMEQAMAQALGMSFSNVDEIHGLQVSEDMTTALPGRRKIYNFAEFVETAFKCYDAQKELMQDVRYTPA